MRTWTTYWLTQNARMGWFLGQYLLSSRLKRASPRAKPKLRRPGSRFSPSLGELLADIRALFERDWRNIRDGLYRVPADDPPARLLGDAVRYFLDFPQVDERRHRDGHDDVRKLPEAQVRGYPEYYLRNFHYQTDGYLSARSARLYDQQVEVLFIGSAAAMRRQALVSIAGFVRRRRGELVHLDVACGTGRFLGEVLDNFPQVRSIGLDLSNAYLAEASRRLGPRPRLELVQGMAETLPLADESVDLATCVYLLHELPDDVRTQAASELARVLRPGGRLVLVDSLQLGDRPAWDRLLESFPRTFHEPFYASYAAADLGALFGAAGLRPLASELAFLSKVMTFERPARGAAHPSPAPRERERPAARAAGG